MWLNVNYTLPFIQQTHCQHSVANFAIELQKKSPVIDRAFFGFGLRQLNTEL